MAARTRGREVDRDRRANPPHVSKPGVDAPPPLPWLELAERQSCDALIERLAQAHLVEDEYSGRDRAD